MAQVEQPRATWQQPRSLRGSVKQTHRDEPPSLPGTIADIRAAAALRRGGTSTATPVNAPPIQKNRKDERSHVSTLDPWQVRSYTAARGGSSRLPAALRTRRTLPRRARTRASHLPARTRQLHSRARGIYRKRVVVVGGERLLRVGVRARVCVRVCACRCDRVRRSCPTEVLRLLQRSAKEREGWTEGGGGEWGEAHAPSLSLQLRSGSSSPPEGPAARTDACF